MHCHLADYFAGVENERKRQRAYEARALDERIVGEMVESWKAAIAMGVTRGSGAEVEEGVLERREEAVVGDGASIMASRAGGEGAAWGSRRALLLELQRAAQQQRDGKAGEVSDARGGPARGAEVEVGRGTLEESSRGVGPAGGEEEDEVGADGVREGHTASRLAGWGAGGERKRLLARLHGEVKRKRRRREEEEERRKKELVEEVSSK